jgi:hypothetical protein
MPTIRNFHESLEKDLSRLTAEIQTRRNESGGEPLAEHELVKQSLGTFRENVPVSAEQSVPAPQSTTGSSASSDDARASFPSYFTDGAVPQAIQVEVEKLIDLVFHDSLERAVREAQKHPPFVEDAFHDALVDVLVPELKKRGAL